MPRSVDLAVDIFGSSAILIVAAAAFHASGQENDGNLFATHALIRDRIGTAPAYLFAVALFLSAQCASITVTMAGQTVSQGFLRWTIRPWLRRIITRCIGMVPSLVVAVAIGPSGIDTLLVASQVALSIALPFVVGP